MHSAETFKKFGNEIILDCVTVNHEIHEIRNFRELSEEKTSEKGIKLDLASSSPLELTSHRRSVGLPNAIYDEAMGDQFPICFKIAKPNGLQSFKGVKPKLKKGKIPHVSACRIEGKFGKGCEKTLEIRHKQHSFHGSPTHLKGNLGKAHASVGWGTLAERDSFPFAKDPYFFFTNTENGMLVKESPKLGIFEKQADMIDTAESQ